MIETLLVATAAFASTNVDDAFVLLAFFSDPKYRAAQVVAGQYIGMATLIGIAIAVALATMALPTSYIGYLGLLPILIGAKRLIAAIREQRAGTEWHLKVESDGRAIASVASITIANGGDNVGTYVPLFAKVNGTGVVLISVLFFVLTAIWCIAGKLLVSHPVLGLHIRRWGHIVVPFVLMAIGVYILIKSGVIRT